MFNKINKLKSSNTFKKLLSNFLSLSVLQLFSYIFPLLTIPYLVRILGIEYFGLISFAGAIIGYFVIMTQYGFELTAVKEVSINKNDKTKLTEIFSSVMTIKFLLLVITFIILVLVTLFFEKFEFEKIVYFLTFGMVIGDVLFPRWFFQGIEQMKYITYINVTSRIVFTALIFVFVTTKEDFYIVPILNSLGVIVGGVYSIYFIYKKFNIKFQLQPLEKIKFYIKDSWHIFISHMGINLYTNALTIILGFFAPLSVVGYYSAAEKLIRAVISLSRPIYQTVYPHIMSLMKESEVKALVFIRRVIIYSFIFSIIVSGLIFVLSDFIVSLLYGENFELTILLLKLLSVLPIIVGLSNITGVQVMMAYDFKKEFSKIIVIIGFLSLLISIPLGYYFQAIGIAISSILVEFIILMAINIFIYKKNIFLLKGVK
jgi:PST family polysaccharide transporter